MAIVCSYITYQKIRFFGAIDKTRKFVKKHVMMDGLMALISCVAGVVATIYFNAQDDWISLLKVGGVSAALGLLFLVFLSFVWNIVSAPYHMYVASLSICNRSLKKTDHLEGQVKNLQSQLSDRAPKLRLELLNYGRFILVQDGQSKKIVFYTLVRISNIGMMPSVVQNPKVYFRIANQAQFNTLIFTNIPENGIQIEEHFEIIRNQDIFYIYGSHPIQAGASAQGFAVAYVEADDLPEPLREQILDSDPEFDVAIEFRDIQMREYRRESESSRAPSGSLSDPTENAELL